MLPGSEKMRFGAVGSSSVHRTLLVLNPLRKMEGSEGNLSWLPRGSMSLGLFLRLCLHDAIAVRQVAKPVKHQVSRFERGAHQKSNVLFY